MRCDLLFPQPVWHEQTKINNDLLLRLCDKIYKMDPKGRERSNRGGWQSNDIHSGEHPEMAALETAVINMSQKCIEDIGYNRKIELHNFWMNINYKYNYNDMHIHPNAVLSGVYYVKCSRKSGDIIFPRNFSDGFILAKYEEHKPTLLNQMMARYTPTVGSIYMFMAHAAHYVEPNTEEQERISIAFNVGCK
jgi:uncharacterized protein (TIGR02466 family)